MQNIYIAKYVFAKNPMAASIGLAATTAFLTKNLQAALIVLVLFAIFGLIVKSAVGHEDKGIRIERMTSRGADFISFSRRDDTVLGYDVNRGMLIIEFGDKANNEALETAISRVRHVNWKLLRPIA